jgi:hypothetical protein
MDELTRELVLAAMAGARELGLEVREVRRGDSQAGLGALLGVRWQGSFMPVFAAPQVCPRVIWVGEVILPRNDPDKGVISRIARSWVVDRLGYLVTSGLPISARRAWREQRAASSALDRPNGDLSRSR